MTDDVRCPLESWYRGRGGHPGRGPDISTAGIDIGADWAVGYDIVLCSARAVSPGQDAVEVLQAAVADGQLDRGAATHALQRVLALRGPVG